MAYTGLGDRHKFHPWGLAGGKEGAAGAFYRVATDGTVTKMGHKTTSFPLKKGDVIRVTTPGAGGYGDPTESSVAERSDGTLLATMRHEIPGVRRRAFCESRKTEKGLKILKR